MNTKASTTTDANDKKDGVTASTEPAKQIGIPATETTDEGTKVSDLPTFTPEEAAELKKGDVKDIESAPAGVGGAYQLVGDVMVRVDDKPKAAD